MKEKKAGVGEDKAGMKFSFPASASLISGLCHMSTSIKGPMGLGLLAHSQGKPRCLWGRVNLKAGISPSAAVGNWARPQPLLGETMLTSPKSCLADSESQETLLTAC